MVDDTQEQVSLEEGLGVSVVICSHNGEKVLPATLAHLKNQHCIKGLKWEVLLIDNASSDNTALVARQCWSDDGPAPMRVVREPQLGLCHARRRGFDEAQYEVVSFIDDDNWVAPTWVATASRCMSTDLQLGAMGSANTAVTEVSFPEWFSRYCAYYAAWDYPRSATIATWFLIGAGMTVRKKTWYWLKHHDFHPQLTDRVGSRLSSSGDVELGCAIRLAGWAIRIEPQLQLKHYIAADRLQWKYLRRLIRSVGQSHVVLDCYFRVSESRQAKLLNRLRSCWWVRLAKESAFLAYRYSTPKVIGSFFRDMEGDDQVAEIDLRIGRLLGLMELRSRYRQLRHDIARAPWRRVGSVDDPALGVGCLEDDLSPR
ncbi:MAG: glycosyltransferase family 2 protein [Deltaproteobacteria bacterium]|nr:glycosyltransferase family 2 protein [Deltaproteobacteria bacterium]